MRALLQVLSLLVVSWPALPPMARLASESREPAIGLARGQAAPALVPALARDLRAGMTLVYESNSQRQLPWSIEAVAPATKQRPNADCIHLRIRRQPAPAPADEADSCIDNDVLYRWDVTRDAWIAERPVGVGMELTVARAAGGEVRYVTGAMREEQIGARTLPVVDTIITTTDASGTPVRRLRERYAVTLATATGGRFEVPDVTLPSGWRLEQAFELREIRDAPTPVRSASLTLSVVGTNDLHGAVLPVNGRGGLPLPGAIEERFAPTRR